jgi:hypothetical protein
LFGSLAIIYSSMSGDFDRPFRIDDVRVRASIKDAGRRTTFRQTWERWPNNTADAGHPLGQWSTVTTLEDPAVIFDDGAAFCSPVLTFDREGNALHFHDDMIAGKDYGIAAQKYFDAVPQYVGRDGVTCCVSGLNVHLREKGLAEKVNPIDEVIDYVDRQIRRRFPNSRVVSLVSKQYPNQRRRSEVVPDNTKSRGFLFVPRYLSSDGQNHLFTVLNDDGNRLRREFGIRKPY